MMSGLMGTAIIIYLIYISCYFRDRGIIILPNCPDLNCDLACDLCFRPAVSNEVGETKHK